MTDAALPNGYAIETWISDVEDRIAALEAELDTTEDKSRALAISREITDRHYQLERRRRYLAEVEEDAAS